MNNDKKYFKRKIITITVMRVLLVVTVILGMFQLNSLSRTDTSLRNQFINSNTPTVVMFYSKTCPDCRKATRIVKLAKLKSFKDPLRSNYQSAFVELHNKDDKQLFNQYHITKTPTFMVFKNGVPQAMGKKYGFDQYQYEGTDKHEIESLYTNLKLK